jgi:hypothetical protein
LPGDGNSPPCSLKPGTAIEPKAGTLDGLNGAAAAESLLVSLAPSLGVSFFSLSDSEDFSFSPPLDSCPGVSSPESLSSSLEEESFASITVGASSFGVSTSSVCVADDVTGAGRSVFFCATDVSAGSEVFLCPVSG